MIKVGVIGTGYWGKQHLRVLSKLNCELVGIADIDESKKELAKNYNVSFFTDYRKLIEKVQAITVVTPPETHFNIARHALSNNCSVLLEKPFVNNIIQSKVLDKMAKSNNLVCIPGHTFLYHPAVKKIKEILNKKELGNLYYLTFQWLNLGIIRRDVNALRNFAPHPFSILNYFFNKVPDQISAVGNSYIQKGIEDVVFITAKYDKTLVQVILSWLHPVKVREISIVGSEKLLVFNDVEKKDKLRLLNKGLSPVKGTKKDVWKSFAEFQDKINKGTEESINTDNKEPLEAELDFFLKVSADKSNINKGTYEALAVMKMLEAAEKSLKKGGGWIKIE